MKATFVQKSKVMKDGNIYEVTPPVTHNGKKYKHIRTYRATRHQTGILIFPSLSGVEVIKQSKTKEGKVTYKTVDEGNLWRDWDVALSHDAILNKIGYEIAVEANA